MLKLKTEELISLEQWDQWTELSQNWTLLPYAVRFPLDQIPHSWHRAWEESSAYSFVLESGKEGRYSFLGLHPVEVLRGKGRKGTLRYLCTGEEKHLYGEPLDLLNAWMSSFRLPSHQDLPKFSGGCVGYLSYDVVRSLERIQSVAQDDLGLDDYVFMRMEELWVIDHLNGTVTCIVCMPLPWQDSGRASGAEVLLGELHRKAATRAEAMVLQWITIVNGGEEDSQPNGQDQDQRKASINAGLALESLSKSMEDDGWTTSFSQPQFEQAVNQIKEYIAAGDVFQVNLSLRHQRPLTSSAEELYEAFRVVNPSPYMGLIRLPEFQLVSGSPELLVKLEDRTIQARPIAGTRRRGRTSEEDDAMAEELRTSEKERAEHIMLVDLERNDLGRVSKYGTVQVSELMTIEYYSHVMHLVSQVEGVLDQDMGPWETIAATFPGGTITGAPKIRTMEIIEELEPVTRGPYTGSMGWIDYRGNMELNIIIRTLVVQEGTGYIQTGAGIVIDSDPYREYRECQNKAKAARAAVILAESTARVALEREE